jgi:hypothetical protein
MVLRRVVVLATVLSILTATAACAASYNERMKFLDQMSAEGIKYRGQLQRQQTNPGVKACEIGWNLLNADVPSDIDGGGVSMEWRAQVEEAYVKSCMTGEALPKPDPSGINARTVVPFSGVPTVGPS